MPPTLLQVLNVNLSRPSPDSIVTVVPSNALAAVVSSTSNTNGASVSLKTESDKEGLRERIQKQRYCTPFQVMLYRIQTHARIWLSDIIKILVLLMTPLPNLIQSLSVMSPFEVGKLDSSSHPYRTLLGQAQLHAPVNTRRHMGGRPHLLKSLLTTPRLNLTRSLSTRSSPKVRRLGRSLLSCRPLLGQAQLRALANMRQHMGECLHLTRNLRTIMNV
jgi:hypothetical protein